MAKKKTSGLKNLLNKAVPVQQKKPAAKKTGYAEIPLSNRFKNQTSYLPNHPEENRPAAKKTIANDRSAALYTKKENPYSETVKEPESGGITRLGGIKKAAKLLLALGTEQAAAVLREMDDPSIEKLIAEIAVIKKISAEEKKSILEEFHSGLMKGSVLDQPVSGGPDAVREMLTKGLGQHKADELLSRVHRQDLKQDFNFLERIEPERLGSALIAEHPQVAAVALSFIHPKHAARVLKSLPDEFRNEVAIRIARTSNTHPDAVLRVAKVLREKFEKRREEEIFSETGGAETLASILNHMDRSSEDNILDVLGGMAPDIMESVRERLYTFEELYNLDLKEMRFLLSRTDDEQLLATALRGAGEDLRRAFFNAMSQNRAADLLDLMEHQGTLSVRKINEARSVILNIARQLEDEGHILIKKDKDEYV